MVDNRYMEATTPRHTVRTVSGAPVTGALIARMAPDHLTRTILIRRCLDQRSLAEVAATYGLTRAECRQIESEGMRRLDEESRRVYI